MIGMIQFRLDVFKENDLAFLLKTRLLLLVRAALKQQRLTVQTVRLEVQHCRSITAEADRLCVPTVADADGLRLHVQLCYSTNP